MDSKKSLTATNLADYHHFNCELYLYNAYNEPSGRHGHRQTSSISSGHRKRGNDWENSLVSWLKQQNLLMELGQVPHGAYELSENILHDEREHFFIYNLKIKPPSIELKEFFDRENSDPIDFGHAILDFLEITRVGDRVEWRVIDAKATNHVKASHRVQVYFYTLCLQLMLDFPFRHTGTAAVWLPPKNGSATSLDDIQSVKINHFSSSLKTFLFQSLPEIVTRTRDEIKWHYNPLCEKCPYQPGCKAETIRRRELGSIPNISLDDAQNLKDILRRRRQSTNRALTDIEDLHDLLADPNANKLKGLQLNNWRKAKKLLLVPNEKLSVGLSSPKVEAALEKSIQVIQQHNYTCPRSEDISVILSVVRDPSSQDRRINYFALSTFSRIQDLRYTQFGQGSDLVPALSSLIKRILTSHQHSPAKLPTTQFYVFSSQDRFALENHLLDAALTSSAPDSDIRMCIGALIQGASLLQTTYQPVIISALESTVTWLKTDEIRSWCTRIGLSPEGTRQQLHSRIKEEIKRLKDKNRTAIDQLPKIVDLKAQVEQLLALPVPGYWSLAECASEMLHNRAVDLACPSDDDILSKYNDGINGEETLKRDLERRNDTIFDILKDLRRRVGHLLVVEEAKVLSADFNYICEEPTLRKLFYMQQFEPLETLRSYWRSRIISCPGAIVKYVKGQTTNKPEYSFRVISDNITDMTKDDGFDGHYDKILVRDSSDSSPDFGIPVEALFDDLTFVDTFNPMQDIKWKNQDPVVQRELTTANISVISPDGRDIKLLLPSANGLVEGAHYRLSPRLTDYTTKWVLPELVRLDAQLPASGHPFFLQMILHPESLGRITGAEEYVKEEILIQNSFSALTGSESDRASANKLVLKPSQQAAVHDMLSNQLSVISGPPGTGKTHTIAMFILRFLDIQSRLGHKGRTIIFLTAYTHAAVQALNDKIEELKRHYRLFAEWFDDVNIDFVKRGDTHLAPSSDSGIFIYAGTVFQLHKFARRHKFDVDCVIVDEASQMKLNLVSLVLTAIRPSGRVVIIGDKEQLAPIDSGVRYPKEPQRLFGSILDCLQGSDSERIVQLTENFRLNADLGNFISTIYAREFVAQTVQSYELPHALGKIRNDNSDEPGAQANLMKCVQEFLLAVSDAMLQVGGQTQTSLRSPLNGHKNYHGSPAHLEISMALINMQTWRMESDVVERSDHLRGEAGVATALVTCIRGCCPSSRICVAVALHAQRKEVKNALERNGGSRGNITVETVDKLQGSEADFVIYLLSLPETTSDNMKFMLDRRRLNVAISRAKELCIVVTSPNILNPSVRDLDDEKIVKGYEYLKVYEERAWCYDLKVNVDDV